MSQNCALRAKRDIWTLEHIKQYLPSLFYWRVHDQSCLSLLQNSKVACYSFFCMQPGKRNQRYPRKFPVSCEICLHRRARLHVSLLYKNYSQLFSPANSAHMKQKHACSLTTCFKINLCTNSGYASCGRREYCAACNDGATVHDGLAIVKHCAMLPPYAKKRSRLAARRAE